MFITRVSGIPTFIVRITSRVVCRLRPRFCVTTPVFGFISKNDVQSPSLVPRPVAKNKVNSTGIFRNKFSSGPWERGSNAGTEYVIKRWSLKYPAQISYYFRPPSSWVRYWNYFVRYSLLAPMDMQEGEFFSKVGVAANLITRFLE